MTEANTNLFTRSEDGFAVIQRAWEGETVAIFASGPSITQADVDLCREFKSIAVNDCYLMAPWADVLYGADARWHKWHATGTCNPIFGLTTEQIAERYAAFQGEIVSIETSEGWEELKSAGRVWMLHNYQKQNAEGMLSEKADGIATGSNSGHQALNIAYLLGAKLVLLLGFDAKKAKDGRMHWFGDHPIPTPESWLTCIPQNFNRMAPVLEKRGVEVINCSPSSKIECFPRMALASFLADSRSTALPA